MIFGWQNEALGLINFIISVVIVTGIFAFLFYLTYKILTRKVNFIFLGSVYLLIIISLVIYMPSVLIIVSSFASGFLILTMFANLGDVRKYLANPFKRAKAVNKNFGVEKLYDHDTFYKNVEEAILALSASKTGALISFERSNSLKEFMKNGVAVKAPFTPELIETIFFPGTRLHDGAVVVHDNEVVAASVFYTPSTKAFADKFGSRHRAGLGISEVCDAVTVIVSEETGRISFAVNGELELVEPNNFLKTFITYMNSNDE